MSPMCSLEKILELDEILTLSNYIKADIVTIFIYLYYVDLSLGLSLHS